MSTLIIAEAGVNHNGSLDLAKELINKAAEAGADVIKFQTFNPEMLTSEFAPMAEYQVSNTGKKESQLDMLKKLTLSKNDHYSLVDHCRKNRIIFCSTPFDLDSISFLSELNLPFWKIPSGELTNLPYLRKIALYNLPVIMSTGMSTNGEVDSALSILIDAGQDRDKITLLHCNTAYPTEYKDVNLLSMKSLEDSFQLPVGYSDHTIGIEIPIAAVALGAVVIEKHFTLNKEMNGPDHKASLDPDELKNMVTSIRNIEIGLGSRIKRPTQSELENIKVIRKSIVASCQIEKGTILSEKNITCKRPANGLSPLYWDNVVGKVAYRDFKKDENIDF